MHTHIYTIILGMKHNLYIYIQVIIKTIRNVTRHRNGQSVKSRQTRWEWQLDFVSHVIVYGLLCLTTLLKNNKTTKQLEYNLYEHHMQDNQ